MNNKMNNKIYKFILMGSTNVGKTCILRQLTDNLFLNEHNITIGVDYGSKILLIDDRHIKISIWDTSGYDKYLFLNRYYYSDIDGILLIYDISDYMSFNKLSYWINEIDEYLQNTKVILIGNKSDLENYRQVSYSLGEKLALNHGYLFKEISTKDYKNLNDLFIYFTKYVLENNIKCPSSNINHNSIHYSITHPGRVCCSIQ